MTTTSNPETTSYKEITDPKGRVYRIGESDRQVLGYPRWLMVILPWVGMMGISVSEYAFGSAEETLHTAHGWSSTHIYWLLAVWVFFQAAVAFPAGLLRDSGKVTARTAMLAGAVFAFLGYLSLSHAPNVFWAYLGFGFFGGAGAGMVYATCVNMVAKWYPERRGGKTGFVNGGFAYGAVPFVFLFTNYMDEHNFMVVLDSVALYVLLAIGISGLFFKDPPANWWPAGVDPLGTEGSAKDLRSLQKNPPAVKQYTPKEAIRTPVLPLMWICLLFTAGVNIFGIAFQVKFGKEMGFAGGVVALAMSLKAIVNGTGRGVIGWISDRYGRRQTLFFVCVILGMSQFGILWSGTIGVMPLFLFFSMVSGFGGGAIFPLFAAMTADFYGENNNASNYGMVYSSKVISGLLGSGAGILVVDAWDYEGAFVIAGCMGLAAAAMSFGLRQPGRPKLRDVQPNPHPISREIM